VHENIVTEDRNIGTSELSPATYLHFFFLGFLYLPLSFAFGVFAFPLPIHQHAPIVFEHNQSILWRDHSRPDPVNCTTVSSTHVCLA
jgi:hypothetical protein